jgi:hypothetical protein
MFAFHDQTAFNTNVSNPASKPSALGQHTIGGGGKLACIQAHNKALVRAAANFLMQADSAGLRRGGIGGPSDAVEILSRPGRALRRAFGLWIVQRLRATERGRGPGSTRVQRCRLASQSPGPVGIESANPPDYILGINLYSQAYNITPTIYSRRVFWITRGSRVRGGVAADN